MWGRKNLLGGTLLLTFLAVVLTISLGGLYTGADTLTGERDASAEPIWTYDSDLDVRHVETTDLNNDGIKDVIAGEYSSTYYGNPSRVIAIDGSNGDTLWTYLLQDGVRSMTIGDLNNDGVMDVIAGAAYHSTQTPDGDVHAINGIDGSPMWRYPVGSTTSCLTVGYINADAYLDVAAGAFDDNVYAINGQNGSLIWYRTVGSMWINAVATADVNGDGYDDVAYAHEYLAGWDNYFGIFSGSDGTDIWDSTVAYLVMDVIIEDIDDDDTLEAIFGGIYSDDHGEIFVRNALTGALEWSYDVGSVDHSNGNIILNSYDIDEDMDLDLFVGTYLGEHLIYAFNGDSNTPMWISDTLDGNTRDISFGDVTGEKDIDVITATSDRVQVISGIDGTKIWYYSIAGTIQSVSCADFDEDEIMEVAAGGGANHSGSDPAVSVWALRTIQSPLLWEYDIGQYGNAIAIADLNDDDAEDVISVCSSGDKAVATSGADGTELWTWVGTQNLFAVTTGDFNNDNQIDVAVGGYDDQVTALYGNNGTVMWTFTTPADQIYRKCLQAADLNGDNNVDVIAGSNDNHVYAISGSNGGELWNRDVGADVNDLRLAQMNGSGPLDVVVAVGGGTYGEKVSVLDGSNGSVLWEFPAPESVEHIEVCDVNDDDIPDVAAAVTPYGTDQIIMIDGSDQTTLWSQPLDNIASNIQSISQGDLNWDKVPDIIVPGNSTDKKVHALSGVDGSELWSFETGSEVNCVLAYDVDNDEQMDVVAGSDDQMIYVINGLDGLETWSYSTAGDVMHTQIGDISGNGLPNIACVTFDSDGIVYAFKSLASGYLYECGDVNDDETVNIFDVTYLISYLYLSGPAPDPMESADVNNDGDVNIFDVTYLILYLYLEGPAPDCP